MRVIVFGATGMVGQGVVHVCLHDPDVTEVITVVRSATGKNDPKLREIVHADFEDFSSLSVEADACFWCLGVTSTGKTEAEYTTITHDYTIAAAKALLSPSMTFVFVSGAGADGSAMWARVKKRTEDAVLEMPFKDVYVFRPALIQPLHGIRSRTRLYNALYPLLWPVIGVAKLAHAGFLSDTDRIGRAMLNVVRKGFPKRRLESADINAAAGEREKIRDPA